MAVTRGRHVIEMTASADAVTDNLIITGLYATGAVTGVDETDDSPIANFAAAFGLSFSKPIYASGLKRGAGAGHLFVYLA